MKDFENEEIRLPKEVIQEREELQKKLFEPKTKEELKTERENESNKNRAKLPEDDTFVEMNIYAKNLTMPKKIRERLIEDYDTQHKIAPDIIKLDLIKDKIPEANINGTNYIIREVINESDGFQAIVFENPYTHECTFTIAGSYSLKHPLLNPAEWYKDWAQNNLVIGLKHLPPQLETAIKNLDRCKSKYNITSITGYSLGAILAGLLSQFKRNKHLKTYLYNGGLPQKLLYNLHEKYGDEISLDEAVNMITMLSKGETVTNLVSIVRGAGIFMLNGGEKGHALEYHEKATAESYKEILQEGIGSVDGLKSEFQRANNGNGIMYAIDVPLDFKSTVKEEIIRKPEGVDTGLAADLFSEEEIEELKKRLEHERLPKETLEKMGEYHKRKFFERIRETYTGDFKDLTPANFIDKDGEFTFIPHDIEPKQTNLIAPTPKTQHTQSGKKDLSKDEKWQSFRKIFRTFFAMPDDNGKPMGKINSTDVYNAIDVMETMKKAMHDSEVTQIPDSKGSIKDLNELKFISDEAQTEMMQSALQKTSNQIKTDVKSEILDEISRQTMFPNREHVENIMRDVFDDVLVRRGYKKSN